MQEQLFVGREGELERLSGYLNKTLAGQGQVCFVTGQAGSGKSVLSQYFLEQGLATDPNLVVAVGMCNAQTGIGDPYLPFREALAMLTGDVSAQQTGDKIAPENANRLLAVVARSVQVLVEVAPDLIGVLVPGGKLIGTIGKAAATKAGWMDQLNELAKPKAALSGPMVEQSRIFEQYTTYLQRLSTKTPLIVFLDDLQWADNASLGLLFQLARHIESSRILIVGAYRPNDVALGRDGMRHPLEPVVHELTRYRGDISIDLDATTQATGRQFVDALLDSEPNELGGAFREALFHKTGGHALFSVELIRSLQERGDLARDEKGIWREGPLLDWDALPARVEGVIAERIARLSDELRQLLTVGSVEGEQFSAEVVARVQAMKERQAVRELSEELQRRHRLVNAEGVVQFGSLRLSLYRFLHNLFQQYLYGGLDKAERAYLHRDVGEVLEALFADQTEEIAAQLARHFEEAGIAAKAAAYRLEAGVRALRMSAHEEAIAHLTRGIELLTDVPPGPERMQLELALQTLLAVVSSVTAGYGSPLVERAFTRARELCQAMGNPPPTLSVWLSSCLFRTLRGEFRVAREDGDQLLVLARQVEHTGYLLAGHTQLGVAALHQGDFEGSRWHLEQAISLHDQRIAPELVQQTGTYPTVISLLYHSWALWWQGYPTQAAADMEAGLRLAEGLGHPYTYAAAAFLAATLHQLTRRWPECAVQVALASELAAQGRFALWQAGCAMVRGSVLAHQGRWDEGIAVLQQGLDGWEATGSRLALACVRARLAEAYLLARRQTEGLEALDASLCMVEEGYWLPEQHRLRGELLLLAPGNEAEAEASFRKALEVARSQGARSFELRAAMSLARLLQQWGRVVEGKELLAQRYAWFTEGFDAPDLRDARELLEQFA